MIPAGLSRYKLAFCTHGCNVYYQVTPALQHFLVLYHIIILILFLWIKLEFKICELIIRRNIYRLKFKFLVLKLKLNIIQIMEK